MAEELVLKCDNCKREGLVRLKSQPDVFECLYCKHKVDLNRTGKDRTTQSSTSNSFGFVMFLLFAIIMVASVL